MVDHISEKPGLVLLVAQVKKAKNVVLVAGT
jgi:hypothetical protein